MELLLGDCLERMKEIPDGSVNMILCDLPYGTTACKWDSVIPFEPLWEQYRRVTKDTSAIVLFGAQPFTAALVMSNPKMFKYCWVWEKSRPSGFAQAKNKPLSAHEDIAVFSAGVTVHATQTQSRMPYFPQGVKECSRVVRNSESHLKTGSDSVFGKRPSHKKEYAQTQTDYPRSVLKVASESGATHPTQKPVALCEYLIRTYTREGETVLDNCMGSGTTGVACVRTNREFIGIEQDENYFKIAESRIANEMMSDLL